MLHQIKTTDRLNAEWNNFYKERIMTIKRDPIFNKSDNVFTLGSCFAREIRFALKRSGVNVGPVFENIQIEKDRFRIDNLPYEPHLNFYNTFSILQEIERVNGVWHQDKDDYWFLKKTTGIPGAGDFRYQDPYRRMVFGKTREDLFEAIDRLNTAVADSARKSSVFFLTFGVAEVFIKQDNGLVSAQKPGYLGGGGSQETKFHLSSTSENLENMKKIRSEIKKLNKDAKILVTVSPVPLERTFSNWDILVASNHGKSTLRTSVGEFERSYDDVFYFPAFEMVTSIGEKAFQRRDLRHVEPAVVETIMRSFLNAHLDA